MNIKNNHEFSVLLATDIIYSLGKIGLLRHNQLTNRIQDMDTGMIETIPTLETIAMIDGVTKIINNFISNYEQ